MMRTARNSTFPRPIPTQAGAALFIALIMLLLITIIGLAAARTQTLEVRMASNTQNRNIAEEAAEAALRFAESGLASGLYNDFSGGTPGLYPIASTSSTTAPPYMCIASWANYAGAAACGNAPYPTIAYTGPAFPSPQQPTFIIEALPPVCSKGCSEKFGARTEPEPPVLRITANGVGGDGTSSVRLQSIYH